MSFLESLRIDTRQLMPGVLNRIIPRRRQSAIVEHVPHKTLALLRHYHGVDIDEYRAKHGKEEGEAKFFFDNQEDERLILRDNLFMFNGACLLWQCALNLGTTSANSAFSTGPTLLTNANAYLYVSDGSPTGITGTVTVTNGSGAVTTTSSSSGFAIGLNVIFSGDSSSQVYSITAGSGTSWTISPVYGGTGGSGVAASTIAATSHSQTAMVGSGSSNIANQVADGGFPANPYAKQFNAITGATNATPIVLTVSGADVSTNDIVHVVEVLGNTGANGIFVANPASASSITLLGSVGNGSYTSNTGYATERSVFTMQSTFGSAAGVFMWNSWAMYNGSGSNKIIVNNRIVGMGSKASGTSSALKIGIAIG